MLLFCQSEPWKRWWDAKHAWSRFFLSVISSHLSKHIYDMAFCARAADVSYRAEARLLHAFALSSAPGHHTAKALNLQYCIANAAAGASSLPPHCYVTHSSEGEQCEASPSREFILSPQIVQHSPRSMSFLFSMHVFISMFNWWSRP